MVTGATAWLALLITAITAIGLVWRKGVIPIRHFGREAFEFMRETRESNQLVAQQMKPNGSTLIQKVDAAAEKADMAAEKAEEAAIVAQRSAHQITVMDGKLNTLLKHDRERDQPGLRYGHPEDIENKVDELLEHDEQRDQPGRRYGQDTEGDTP